VTGSPSPQPVRTADELAAAIAVPVGTAEGVLRDFARRGIVVETVEPGSYALTEHGREVAVGFSAAGEEGFRGAE
jgi:DNA-binding IclR family transcriptional regulator